MEEGLAKDQWCYLPNEQGQYAEGMTTTADVLQRTGYRLPTEAEWEYACRAGAVTTRYYGHSIDLLDAYARYDANSREHAWAGGSLLPNDLGLFDMLGNMYEWCQEKDIAYRPGKKGVFNDIIIISDYARPKNPRRIRGGAFDYLRRMVRSANRNWYQASERGTGIGFRLARTYP
jgi:eukaryotic-like serine/threonine-protein kinase